MVRRYLLLGALIVVVSVATSFGVYRLTNRSQFQSSCTFQVSLPVTSQAPSSDILVFNRQLAANEVLLAAESNVLAVAALQAAVPVSDVIGHTSVSPGGTGGSTFVVSATNASSHTAVVIANAVCGQYITRIQAQRAAEAQSEETAIRKRMDALQSSIDNLSAKPPSALSASDRLELSTEQGALQRNQQLLIADLSVPPDNISLVAPASPPAAINSKSLRKDVIVGAAVGFLLTFVLVIVSEAVIGSRRGPP
jgi:uncharacterized protein involved in exopolysaccharide biosynthesis